MSKSWMIHPLIGVCLTSLFIGLVLLSIALAGCSPKPVAADLDELPPGSVLRGETLFAQSINGAPPCSTCHTLNGADGIGPSLNAYNQQVGSRTSNLSATEYIFYSIVQPSRHTTDGYPNVMYARYGDKLSPQDIADLIAFVLSH